MNYANSRYLKSTGDVRQTDASAGRIDSLIGTVLAFKLFADMLPQVHVLDYVALGGVIVALVIAVRDLVRVHMGSCDFIAVVLILIIAVNAYLDQAGVVIAIKMASAFALYFLGKSIWRSFNNCLHILTYATMIVVVINFGLLVMGKGFQAWGGASTFSGAYYFKTDLANAMALAVALSLFNGKPNAKLRFGILMMASAMLLLSNARAYYFIWAAMIFLYIQMRRGKRVTIRTVALLVVLVVAMLFLLRALGNSELFRHFGFISFQFNNIAELFNGSNTQGRNLVFAAQLEKVMNSSLPAQLFGNGFTGDSVYVNGTFYGAHSLYVGTLFNLGIVGLVLFLFFMVTLIVRAAKIESLSMRYLIISLAVIFMVSGLSVDVLQYTANSWVPFFFLGYADTVSRKQSDFQYSTPVSSLVRKQESVETTNIYSGIEAAPRGRC